MKDWKYYLGAAMPDSPPHIEPNVSSLKSRSFWNKANWDGAAPLFARWTTDWDCPFETGFWYVIKDTPFDLASVKAKRRYEINKGLKNFDVMRIIPKDCAKDFYNVYVGALKSYAENTVSIPEFNAFCEDLVNWRGDFYGAFDKQTGALCGWAAIRQYDGYIGFNMQKALSEYEPLGVNFALVYAILKDIEPLLSGGTYFLDGARNVNHNTDFQGFLIKYFGFRKAYCRLNIKYSPILFPFVKIAYPMRKIVKALGKKIGFVHKISALLDMEEIVRTDKKLFAKKANKT